MLLLYSGMRGVEILVGTNILESGGTHYTPKKYIIHEKYDRPLFSHDIGLIQVDKIEFNAKVQPIKLSRKFVESGEKLLVTGWGYLHVRWVLTRSMLVILILNFVFSALKIEIFK